MDELLLSPRNRTVRVRFSDIKSPRCDGSRSSDVDRTFKVRHVRDLTIIQATLEHHKTKVHEHPSVPKDAGVAKCPVAGGLLNA